MQNFVFHMDMAFSSLESPPSPNVHDSIENHFEIYGWGCKLLFVIVHEILSLIPRCVHQAGVQFMLQARVVVAPKD